MREQSFGHRYPDVERVPAQADFPLLEEEVLAFWEEDETFAASLELRANRPEYVFYDGPPFANGLPHYGHLLTGFVKDAIPRYQTLKGRHVGRRFGWDCHGLPAETAAERELGVSGRETITAYGIDRFTEYCKSSVLRYSKAWQRYITRQARWVDFVDDYKTMDLSYMESVLWAFKTLYDRGLIYEGYRVLPYCWECETPLSNFETRQDDAYRERVDLALTVGFELVATGESDDPLDGPVQALVWTTTPWTLPSNLALAVGPELTYVLVEHEGALKLLGAERLSAYDDELAGARVVKKVRGEELVGRSYRPLFDYFADQENAFVVLAAEFVATDEGTGIVHMAPGFGEDDQRVCEANGIAVRCPVDDRGRFTSEVSDYEGLQVFEANAAIKAALERRGALLRAESYTHSYPHCWRSETPLIYRAVSSYFVAVTSFKDRMVELNRSIEFFPSHVRDGAFGKWLEGARDWSISRNRFWGAPVPVWKSDDPAYPRVDVYGSLAELEADFGVRLLDLHRPGIDELTRPNPDDPTGRSVMRRVSDVLDCWFESGSMPFAQLHYPFENEEHFEKNFPADFICEYVSQTRGWFYTLHVLSTALFDKPSFSHCIAHGVVLGDDGRKLSKRLSNFPDPEEFFARFGADTMRWYLLSSAVLRGQDIVIEEQAMAEPIRHVLNPIWNAWHFLCLYAGIDKVTGTVRVDQQAPLDRYVLAKTRDLLEQVDAFYGDYNLAAAAAAISRFVEVLTNWYVRRSRERFWAPFGISETTDDDKRDAYDTLHTVLVHLCAVAAPLLPFLTESIYKGLTGERSIHLSDWPDKQFLPSDPGLVEAMDLVRDVCSAGHSIRKARGLRSRLPLWSLTVAGEKAGLLEPFFSLIKDELNVKQVIVLEDAGELATDTLVLVPAALGPRLSGSTQQVIAAWRRGEWLADADGVEVGGVRLLPGEYELVRTPRDEEGARVLERDGVVVHLECNTTPELEAEGRARDLVRHVQQLRKDEGLFVADKISLALFMRDELKAELSLFFEEIAAQTLAEQVEVHPFELAPAVARRVRLAGGETVAIRIERVG